MDLMDDHANRIGYRTLPCEKKLAEKNFPEEEQCLGLLRYK